jgi:hypothetical protein
MSLYKPVDLKEEASSGSTSSGSIATVSMPLGTVQKRIPQDNLFYTKYTNDDNPTPNTPDAYKSYKRNK